MEYLHPRRVPCLGRFRRMGDHLDIRGVGSPIGDPAFGRYPRAFRLG